MATKKAKFNFMDGVIIVIILLAIAIGILLLFPEATASSPEKNVTIRYTVELQGCEKVVAEEFLNAYKRGDKLRVGEREQIDSKIVSIDVHDAMVMVVDNSTKTIKFEPNIEYRDITLVLETPATETEDDILIGDAPIRVGSRIAVKGNKVSAYDYVTKLDIVNAKEVR